MPTSLLICDQDEERAMDLQAFLKTKNYEAQLSHNGKDCQLKVYKNHFKTLVLDLGVQNHSSLAVLKYMRLNAPSVKVILTAESQKLLDSLELGQKEIQQLGIGHLVIKPYSNDHMLRCIEQSNQFEEWKRIKPKEELSDDEVVSAFDDEFTKINIEDFYSGNATIFDHYVKLAKNKYVKILHKGEYFDSKRLERYIKEENVTHLYFLTRDRSVYINFINNVLQKLNENPSQTLEKRVSAAKNLVEKYVEEVYTKGLHPQLLEEGKKICDGLYKTLDDDEELRHLLKRMQEEDPNAHTHHFLVSLFSTMTCKKLEWGTQRTVDIVSMGSILHDIGKLKLPKSIRDIPPKKMTVDQRKQFERHPELGLDMLRGNRSIPEAVKQIVYQHHELTTGDGFPNKLTGVKIYPPAKIVSFCDAFSHHIVNKKLTPLEGIKQFLAEKKEILKYDPVVIRAFMKNFTKAR